MQNWAIANCRRRTCKIKVNMLKFSLLLLLTSERFYRNVKQWCSNSAMQILRETWQILLLRFRINPEATRGLHTAFASKQDYEQTVYAPWFSYVMQLTWSLILYVQHVHLGVCMRGCACTSLWMHVLRKKEIMKNVQEWHWRVSHSEDAKYHVWYS